MRKIKPSKGSMTKTEKWTARLLKDEVTGALSYEFTFPVGDGTVGSLELGNELSAKEMSRSLARQTTLLPKTGAEAFVRELIDTAPRAFVSKAHQPGWRPLSPEEDVTAFVTPGQIIGSQATKFRWGQQPGSRPHIGQQLGDPKAWSASVGGYAEQSNYVAFAIMAALAGPLLRFVDLPEDPAFNFVGPSSGGKTGAARVGASALGHPDAIKSWDLFPRGVEEAAAAHNDLLLVLNAAEKASPTRRREVLNRIVHMVAERHSTGRSKSVQNQLPDLTWRTVLLSTSNKTGAQMAKELKLPWGEQEAVRFIDIPVPGPREGGIF